MSGCTAAASGTNAVTRLTERVVEGVGDRLVPLGLEEGQAGGRHAVLVLPVEL